MPEGGEVCIKTNEIVKFIVKQKCRVIVSIEWDEKSRYSNKKHGPILGFDEVRFPLLIDNIFSRGKLIILKCVEKETGKDKYVVIHLGMTGDFIFGKENKEKHSNLWVNLENDNRIYFTDPRKFGSCSIHDNLDAVYKKNGPCLMTAALLKHGKYVNRCTEHVANKELWNKILCSERLANKPICEFMMEQKYVSGIGNYLRAEILYHAKLHPDTKLCELNEDVRDKLYDTTLNVMYSSWKTKGPSKGYIEGGCFKLHVYGREKDHLGNDVYTYSDSKKRTVHYVPAVQL